MAQSGQHLLLGVQPSAGYQAYQGTPSQSGQVLVGLDPRGQGIYGSSGGGGTVTQINAGTGITLSPSPITVTGSVALQVPVAVANGGTGNTTGAIAGDVTGTIAASVVGALQGRTVAATAPTSNQVLAWSGSNWAPATPAAGGVTSITAGTNLTGGTITTTGTIALASSVSSIALASSNVAASTTDTVNVNNVTAVTGQTLTAAQVVNNLLTRSGPTAAFTDTLPTATLLNGAIAGVAIGSTFAFIYNNTTAYAATIAAGAGDTIVASGGTFSCAANASIVIKGVVTAVATPAVTLFPGSVAAAAGAVAVQFDNSSNANNASAASLTYSHTVNAGANRLLLVAVTTNQASITGVTYGGTALTQVVTRTGGMVTAIFQMVNPPVGTANIVATAGAAGTLQSTASSFFNVNQSAPIANSNGANATTGLASVAVSVSSPNDLVFESMGGVTTGAVNLWSTTSEMQQPVTNFGGTLANAGVAIGLVPTGTATFTTNWANGIFSNWANVAVDIAAAPGPAPPAGTPVQQVATTSASVTATSLTFAHTISAGSNRALFVTVTNGAGTPTGVTYAALAMTQVVLRTNTYTASVWVLVNPPVGTANVVVTMSTNSGTFATANSFVNVNQTTPYANTTSAIGTTMSTPLYTLTIASPNDMVVEAFACSAGGTNYLWSTTAAVQVGFSASANPFAGAVAALPANAVSYPSGLAASFATASYWAAAAVEVAHA